MKRLLILTALIPLFVVVAFILRPQLVQREATPPTPTQSSLDIAPTSNELPERASSPTPAATTPSTITTSVDDRPEYPIPTSPSLARLLSGEIKDFQPLADLHHKLEREPKDLVWASPIEADVRRITTELAPNGEISVETIECRTTMCELQVLVSPGQQPRWQQLVDRVKQAPSSKTAQANLQAMLRDPATGSFAYVMFFDRR